MTIKRLWNMIRWGSEDGPAIEIDWEARTITIHRMGRRQAARVVLWLARGSSGREMPSDG